MLHLEEVKSYLETYSANKQQQVDEDVVIVSIIKEKQVTQLSETLGCWEKKKFKRQIGCFCD